MSLPIFHSRVRSHLWILLVTIVDDGINRCSHTIDVQTIESCPLCFCKAVIVRPHPLHKFLGLFIPPHPSRKSLESGNFLGRICARLQAETLTHVAINSFCILPVGL